MKNEGWILKSNVAAATLISDVLETMLGPCGSQKIVADREFFLITGDVKDIIETVDVDHPIVNLVVKEIGNYREYVGDGTVRAIVLMSRLLNRAVRLIDQGLHPTIVVKGYLLAIKKVEEILNEIAEPVSTAKTEILRQVIKTTMAGKIWESDLCAGLLLEAIRQIMEEKGEGINVDSIKVFKKPGESIFESEVYRGLIIKKRRERLKMPQFIKNAKVALFMCPVKTSRIKMDAEIVFRSGRLDEIIKSGEKIAGDVVSKISSMGANVVLCYEDIDDIILDYLADSGIMAFTRNAYSDMIAVSKVTGASLIYDFWDLSAKDLGTATYVKQERIGHSHYVYFGGNENSKFVTVVLKGSKQTVINAEKAMHQALKVITALFENKKVVAGGGATLMELAIKLRAYGESVTSKEALAIGAFADALEDVVSVLIANSGADPLSILSDLRREHYEGSSKVGVLLPYVMLENMVKVGIIEPLKIVQESLKFAGSLAITLLNIDDIIRARKAKINEVLADEQAKEDFYKRIKEAEERGEDWIRKYKKIAVI